MDIRSSLAVALVGVSCVVFVPTASACLHAVYTESVDDATLVQRAERQLRNGRAPAARRSALALLRRTDGLEQPTEDDLLLRERAERINSIATIRVYWDEHRSLSGREDAQVRSAMVWLWSRPSSPLIQARVAEGHLALGNFEQAGRILRHLHREDLMPDAFAYRALAAVELQARRPTSTRTAIDTCRVRAGSRADSVCSRVVMRPES